MARRPATVNTAGVLTLVGGVANVLVGDVLVGLVVVGLLPRDDGLPTGILLATGGGYCALGALTLLGVPAILDGRPGGRGFVTVLMTVRIVVACFSFGLFGTWYSAGSAIGVGLSIVVIGLLWDSRANTYFHRPEQSADLGRG